MGRSRQDVGGYRGRRTITDILRWIAIVLAVVVVLAIAGVVYLQRYVVYTDEGAKLELPPFLQSLRQGREEPEGSASVSDLGDVSFTEGSDQSEPDPEPDPGPEPEPEPEPAGFALSLTVDEVVNGTAAAKVEAAGAKAVVIEVKDPLGRLAWPSEQAIAGRSYVNGQQAAADALRRWNQGDVYTVARVHCFRDDIVPYYNNRLALRWAGTEWNWRDELGLRWTSPGQEDVRAYNAALCGELAAMGFDEIVLEDFHFPIQGKLDTIRQGESYDPAQFAAQVEDFLTRVQAAVEPYGTKFSLRAGRDTLAGEETASGVTAELLDRYATRVWTDTEGLAAAAGFDQDRLVEIVEQAGEDSAVFQAVIPAEEPPKPII